MPQNPTLRVRIPPDPRHAHTVRGAYNAFVSLHGVTDADRDALLFGVGEALANAIEHGTAAGDIEVTVEIESDRISARIADAGQGFSIPSHFTPLPEPFAERGRGIPIMQRLVDRCEVECVPGDGTVVTLGRFRRDASPPNQERVTRP
ncbi:MAG TPA: ATP-binding protein [Candidatus Acidoferrum sp.]|jgi:anti-sigma regulatory factor (Ser/Thr protein kinase)|nr:ATP-binding protein [Candidatus Acidoferrum sp.]